MQLLVLTRQNAAGNSIVRHQVESHCLPQALSQPHATHTAAAAVQHDRRALSHEDHESASVLDTPAPRTRPPVPTQYESTTADYKSHAAKSSASHPGRAVVAFLAAKVCVMLYV